MSTQKPEDLLPEDPDLQLAEVREKIEGGHEVVQKRKTYFRYILAGVVLLLLAAWGGWHLNADPASRDAIYAEAYANLDEKLLFFFIAGLIAQIIDGALGMAYGASCSSLLLSFNVPPAVASASVHVAEVFTTGVSGISHLRLGNVNKLLFRSLLIPGCLGAIVGAYLLADVIDGDTIKPFMSLYLIILGIVILRKAFKKVIVKTKIKRLGLLAAFGGFMDSIGGGGWGPIVTSTLLSKGRAPRFIIGSVNTAEFFVAFSSAIVFLVLEGVDSWKVIIGLVLGGSIAAPFAAYIVKFVKPKFLMVAVGILVILLSVRNIYKSQKTIMGWFSDIKTTVNTVI